MKKELEKTIAESMKIEIAFPECVHIELVQANDLRYYEKFLWLVSLLASTSSGFWVSFMSISFNKALFISSIAFTVLTLIFAWVAFYFRQKIKETKLKKVLIFDNFNNK